jgi:nucleoside-diphosphate-sugar epimerase
MSPSDGRVIPEFIARALRNAPLVVNGDGLQTRSFCFVSDLIEALYKMLTSPSNGFEIFNLGNPSEITVLDLAHDILTLTNSKSKIIHVDALQDDPLRRCPDISLARARLNWPGPKIQLGEGLQRTILSVRNSNL